MQKIKKIVASVLLVTIIFLMIPFDSFASPNYDPVGGWGDSTSDNFPEVGGDPEAWNNYWKESYESFAEPIFDICRNAGYALTEFDEGAEAAAAYIYYYLMPSGVIEDYAPPALVDSLEAIKNKWIEGTDQEKQEFIKSNFIISNNKVVLVNNDIKDAINWLGNQTVEKAENSMLLYQTYSLDEIDKFLLWEDYENLSGSYVPMSKNGVIDMVTSTFSDNDYPLLFQRWTSSSSFVSLSNIANEYDIDGFVCSSHWDTFSQFFSTFQNNGYVNAFNGQEIISMFTLFSNGRNLTNIHDYKRIDKRNLNNPFSVPAYSYSEWRPNVAIRGQSCIISNDGAPIIFFKDTESYLNFYDNKGIIPYDFNGSSIDYTDFFNNLDKSALDSAESLSDIYAILDDTIAKGLQDAVDRLTTNNEWLKKIYKDLHDWKKDWNIRNIFSTLTDIIGAVDDLLSINRELMRLVNNQIDSEVIDDIEGIIHNTSLLAHIKSKFPFCIPIALVSTADYISSFEPMPLKFSISSNSLGVPLYFNFDYEEIPGHTTVTVIVKSFIFLIFAFGMFKLTLNIMGKIGGGS